MMLINESYVVELQIEMKFEVCCVVEQCTDIEGVRVQILFRASSLLHKPR